MLGRSPGIHLSGVIRDLAIRLGYLKPQSRDTEAEEITGSNYMQLGCGMEYALIQRYTEDEPNRYFCPGELCIDDIYLTPDMFDGIRWAVHEIKMTWKIDVADPMHDKFWMYRTQLKAYCYALQSTVGHLHVAHVNGTGFGGPTYKEYAWEWSVGELKRNWRMIVGHSKHPDVQHEKGT
jgi:hypothetical protein